MLWQRGRDESVIHIHKVARMDLKRTRDVQRRRWESGKDSNGVSRFPGLERECLWCSLGAVLDTSLVCSVSVCVRRRCFQAQPCRKKD